MNTPGSGISGNSHLWLWLGVAMVAAALLYLLAPILAPFLAALMLAYIFNPLVMKMSRKLPRSLAVTLMLLMLAALFVVLLLILMPLLARQVKSIVAQSPLYIDWIKANVAPLAEHYLGVTLDLAMLKDWLASHTKEIQSVALSLLPSLKSGGLALLEFAASLVLVPVVLFYFARDWDALLARGGELVPRHWYDKVATILREIDAVLGEFLRGQLLVMMLMAAFYTIGLWLVGLDYALSVGLIAGFLTFVPYLGVIAGVVIATLTGLLQFGDLTHIMWIWGVFVAANILEGNVFVPWLVGDRIGLHPVAVIFALLAFGQLFGFAGVLLALPASAALLVWLRHLRRSYMDSGMYTSR